MTMNWKTLAFTLKDFADKPNLTWGDPTYDYSSQPGYVPIQRWWKLHDSYWTLYSWGYPQSQNFWWYTSDCGGNSSHQGLNVWRDADGNVESLRFSTVCYETRSCYIFNYDFRHDAAAFFLKNRPSVAGSNEEYARTTEVDEFDSLVRGLMLAKLPPHLATRHRPRSIISGMVTSL